MGGTAAIVVGGLLAGSVMQKAMAPDIPNPGTPQLPEDAKADPAKADAEARKKQQQQRRTAAASGGREGTMLTGPQGLSEIQTSQPQQKSTLLGY
ncbi:MAG: hypothetical protein ACK5ZS_00055 [bacterium]